MYTGTSTRTQARYYTVEIIKHRESRRPTATRKHIQNK